MNRLSCLNGFYLILKILELYVYIVFFFFLFFSKVFWGISEKKGKKTAKILFCKKKKKTKSAKMTLLQNALFSVF